MRPGSEGDFPLAEPACHGTDDRESCRLAYFSWYSGLQLVGDLCYHLGSRGELGANSRRYCFRWLKRIGLSLWSSRLVGARGRCKGPGHPPLTTGCGLPQHVAVRAIAACGLGGLRRSKLLHKTITCLIGFRLSGTLASLLLRILATGQRAGNKSE